MRFASLEHFGLSAWRLGCVCLASASAAWLFVDFALGVLGEAKPAAVVAVSALVFYLVASVPRRLLDRQRVAEAREAVVLAASARACLEVTGSRARTLMAVRPREPATARAVRRAARLVLLGARVEDALADASARMASYTGSAALRQLAELRPEGFDTGDEESAGLAAYGDLSMETRVPMFMTVCFFAPIMALLYAVFTRSYGPAGVAELTVLVFVVVDLAYYLSSAEREA
ncbi:MAG: hypothetical protein JRM80_09620 [Nitrososphaerota archaeon]|nr:hypothetical protein [Nitrososphaerota archaeon]